MDSLRYAPLTVPRPPAKKRPAGRLLLSILLLSVFFIKPNPVAVANQTDPDASIVPDELAQLNEYLAVTADAPDPLIYAKSYLILDVASTEILVGKNINDVVPIASTTKMVTALVAKEKYGLDEVVTVKRLASGIGGSVIGLVYQEKITVRNLLKALLINSGNDAAFALAEHSGVKKDDYQTFVGEMNSYVMRVGLKNTVFGDPAGLDDETGRSTAHDLAQIARLVLQDPVLAEIAATQTATIYSTDGSIAHQLESSNRLLLNDSPYYLPGAIGIKTGFTHAAGHCLVSAYQSIHGLLIAVVLNTVEYTTTASAAESKKLYLWADRYLESRTY